MIRKPRIAVIIVCYNGREYIPDCLNSLKKQTFLPNQIIVVDNASKDGSLEYIKNKFSKPSLASQGHTNFWRDGKIDLIVNQKNKGFAQANNQGIELALEEKEGRFYFSFKSRYCFKKRLFRKTLPKSDFRKGKSFCLAAFNFMLA